jgi:hypothetical protein
MLLCVLLQCVSDHVSPIRNSDSHPLLQSSLSDPSSVQPCLCRNPRGCVLMMLCLLRSKYTACFVPPCFVVSARFFSLSHNENEVLLIGLFCAGSCVFRPPTAITTHTDTCAHTWTHTAPAVGAPSPRLFCASHAGRTCAWSARLWKKLSTHCTYASWFVCVQQLWNTRAGPLFLSCQQRHTCALTLSAHACCCWRVGTLLLQQRHIWMCG